MSYWRVIQKGSLGAVESWSTSTAFGIVGISPDVPDQSITDAMANAIRTATTSGNVGVGLLSLMSNSAAIHTIRVERRAEDESVLNVSEALLVTPLPGTGTATKTPQDAAVISLRTATPGPRGRGRMYWPALAATLSSSFQITSPTPTVSLSAAKVWLQAINTAMDNVYIGQASALRVALSVRSGTDHLCRNVTSMQFGSILDTQRRRRDILPESYVNVAYP
jgi:hypothetical protein